VPNASLARATAPSHAHHRSNRRSRTFWGSVAGTVVTLVATTALASSATALPVASSAKGAAPAVYTTGAGTPRGNLDNVVAVPGGVKLRGWAWDSNTTAPVAVNATVGGATTQVLANGPRPDVERALPDAGSARGFETTIAVAEGTHDVCVTLLNVGPGSDKQYPCVPVGVPGAPGAPAPILAPMPAPAGASKPAAVLPTQPTKSAASFTDSVGVNVHWSYDDTPYGYAYPQVKDLLVKSGLRHVRGDTRRASDLYKQGIKTTVLIDSDMQGRGDPVTKVRALAPLAIEGSVVAVEGPNESDLFWVNGARTYKGLPFPDGLVAWQKDLYETAKSDPRTAGLTVLGPTFGKTYWANDHPFAPNTFASMVDWGNFHPYPGSNPFVYPARYAGIDKYYWNSDFPSIALDKHPINFTAYRPPFGDKPMAASETGYSTYNLGQSEAVQGKYMPRLFLENYRLGIKRTYSYEFIDSFKDPAGTDREAHFGLVRNDLTPKPAYFAMQSLMSAISDAAQPIDPSKLSGLQYAMDVQAPAGYDPSYLHHLAFEKSDGSVVIAMWHEVSGNDISGTHANVATKSPRKEVSHPPMTVRLDLASRAEGVTMRTIGDNGRLAAATATRAGSVYTVSVPDRVTLVTVPAR
jgi:hypothetical protein